MVNKICSIILGEVNIDESSLEDIKKDQIKNLNIFQKFARILSNIFIPIILVFSAAKEFGANSYLAAALGGILIHPALQNAWIVGNEISGYSI